MNKVILNKKLVLRQFSFLSNIFGKNEEPIDKISQPDKDKHIKIKDKEMPIKEDKINQYYRSKIKQFDGRLN